MVNDVSLFARDGGSGGCIVSLALWNLNSDTIRCFSFFFVFVCVCVLVGGITVLKQHLLVYFHTNLFLL